MSRKHVIVVGGSCNGMAVALALSKQGHRVTILEKDELPECGSPVEAFSSWDRRGAPQVMHSHAFLARLHNSIAEHAPDFYQELLEAGAEQMRFTDMVGELFPDADFIPSDDEIVLLACRRMTYDWVLKRHLERTTDTIYRDGTEVEGLEAMRDEATGLPRVTGVRLRGLDAEREVLAADLVIDASGRRTKLGRWLREIGANELEEEVTDCGIFYSSRFYRLLEGVEPPPLNGHIGADLGYMKYAIFPGDSRIFSVTLAASPEDDDLRGILRSDKIFDAAALALPATAAWVDPAVCRAPAVDARRRAARDGDPEKAVSERTRDNLETAVGAAERAAARTGRVQWVAMRTEISRCDGLEIFRASPHPERFYWERPAERRWIAALGCTAEIESAGADRFRDSSAWTQQLFEGLHVAGEMAPSEAGPFLVGGFAFFNEASTAAHWGDFPGGRLVLRRY